MRRLRRLREITAMAGAILAARVEHIPVLIDGYRGDGGSRHPAGGQSFRRSITA